MVDLFQCKTSLIKLMARRRFYYEKMNDKRKLLSIIFRVRQLDSDRKAMDVTFDDRKMVMTFLCGLVEKYEHLMIAIKAAADDSKLTMDFVKSLLFLEEHRMVDQGNMKLISDSAPVNSGNNCHYFYKNGHD